MHESVAVCLATRGDTFMAGVVTLSIGRSKAQDLVLFCCGPDEMMDAVIPPLAALSER